MSVKHSSSQNLVIRGPRLDGEFEIYEAVDESSSNEKDWIYSCVALCKGRSLSPNSPPRGSLGGTRFLEKLQQREDVCNEAKALSSAMNKKLDLLDKAEARFRQNGETKIFHWGGGGKGVIWAHRETGLTPERLLCHGKLINSMQGRYIGSEDQGVKKDELELIARATDFTVGLACGRDTGEATACGVISGIETALKFTPELGTSLKGLAVIVFGAGKVGVPLIHQLHAAGAKVYVFDPDLKLTEESVHAVCSKTNDDVKERQECLMEILRQGRILDSQVKDSEKKALSHPDIQVASPNGGGVSWLQKSIKNESLESDRSRAELLAENRRKNGRLSLILGAGNEQVASADNDPGREEALRTLDAAGVRFVPDSIVSPGGVIAVSHEQAVKEKLIPVWDAARVNADAKGIVRVSVEQLFQRANNLGRISTINLYKAFEEMIKADKWS